MFRLIYCNTASQEESEKIAKMLLKNKLAACINIIPKVKSLYFWDNQLCEDEEFVMIIKTIKDNTDHIIDQIKIIHQSDCPAIYTTDITNGSQEFLNWIEQTVNKYA